MEDISLLSVFFLFYVNSIALCFIVPLLKWGPKAQFCKQNHGWSMQGISKYLQICQIIYSMDYTGWLEYYYLEYTQEYFMHLQLINASPYFNQEVLKTIGSE